MKQPGALVYEKLFPESKPTAKRGSLFFTELCNIQGLINLKDESVGKTFGEDALVPYYSLRDKQDDTLLFESRFESGNLCMALKVLI